METFVWIQLDITISTISTTQDHICLGKASFVIVYVVIRKRYKLWYRGRAEIAVCTWRVMPSKFNSNHFLLSSISRKHIELKFCKRDSNHMHTWFDRQIVLACSLKAVRTGPYTFGFTLLQLHISEIMDSFCSFYYQPKDHDIHLTT